MRLRPVLLLAALLPGGMTAPLTAGRALLSGVAATSRRVTVEGPAGQTGWYRDRIPVLLTEVESALGYTYPGKVRVLLVSTDAAFRRVAGPQPDWVVAVALPARSTLAVRLNRVGASVGTDVVSVLRHEMVHLLLPSRLGGYGRVPLWFEEGLAQALGARVNRIDLARLPVAAAAGALIPLKELSTSFPSSETRAALAYAQGESVIEFLLVEAGASGLRRLLDTIRDTKSFRDAIRFRFGWSLDDLERHWREWLSREGDPWWYAIISQQFFTLLLVGAGLIVIAGVLLVRRRRREVYDDLPE